MSHDLLSSIISTVPSCPVRTISAGPRRSFARSTRGGIASTVMYRTETEVDVEFFMQSGATARELAEKIKSPNTLEASIAMAIINSALPLDGFSFSSRNARELVLAAPPGCVLALIGHFCFLERLRPHFKDVLVFELNPQPGDLPATEIPRRLREADYVAITGTTLINGTFESVISSVRQDAYSLVLGPSTPFAPLLFDRGIDALCGTSVTDPDIVERHIRLGSSPHDHAGIAQLVLEAVNYLNRQTVPAGVAR